jgi:hypothetical protein
MAALWLGRCCCCDVGKETRRMGAQWPTTVDRKKIAGWMQHAKTCASGVLLVLFVSGVCQSQHRATTGGSAGLDGRTTGARAAKRFRRRGRGAQRRQGMASANKKELCLCRSLIGVCGALVSRFAPWRERERERRREQQGGRDARCLWVPMGLGLLRSLYTFGGWPQRQRSEQPPSSRDERRGEERRQEDDGGTRNKESETQSVAILACSHVS